MHSCLPYGLYTLYLGASLQRNPVAMKVSRTRQNTEARSPEILFQLWQESRRSRDKRPAPAHVDSEQSKLKKALRPHGDIHPFLVPAFVVRYCQPELVLYDSSDTGGGGGDCRRSRHPNWYCPCKDLCFSLRKKREGLKFRSGLDVAIS